MFSTFHIVEGEIHSLYLHVSTVYLLMATDLRLVIHPQRNPPLEPQETSNPDALDHPMITLVGNVTLLYTFGRLTVYLYNA